MHVFQSVLQQQASRNLKCECNFSSLQANCGEAGASKENSGSSNELENLDTIRESSASSVASASVRSNVLQQNISKKQGVSGESCDVNVIGCSSDKSSACT